MLEGQRKYDRIKPFSLIPWIISQDEIFLQITEREVPGIYPYYMISNYGRIFHIYNKINPFMSYNLDSKGYWTTPVQTEFGKKMIRNHRIELLVFNYRYDNSDYVADHISGNKLDMRLSNLQWLTFSENNSKSINQLRLYSSIPPQIIPDYITMDMNLQNEYREKNKNVLNKPFYFTNYNQKNFNEMRQNFNCQSSGNIHSKKTKHSEEEKIKICEMLQQGYTQSYIANILHIKKSYVSAILHKQTATEISNNYDFSNYGSIPYHDKWIFTTEQVEKICEYLEKNPIETYNSKKSYIKKMFSILYIDYTDARYRTVLDIYNRRGYLSVSSKYKF